MPGAIFASDFNTRARSAAGAHLTVVGSPLIILILILILIFFLSFGSGAGLRLRLRTCGHESEMRPTGAPEDSFFLWSYADDRNPRAGESCANE